MFKSPMVLLVFALIAVWIVGGVIFSLSQLNYTQGQLTTIQTVQRYRGCFTNDQSNLPEMEKLGRFKLPLSAKNPEPYSEDFCNTFYLRFEMDRADLNRFIESTQVRFPLSSSQYAAEFTTLPADLKWNVKGLKSLWAGQAISSGIVRQSILIDRNDMQHYIVYMIVRDLTN